MNQDDFSSLNNNFFENNDCKNLFTKTLTNKKNSTVFSTSFKFQVSKIKKQLKKKAKKVRNAIRKNEIKKMSKKFVTITKKNLVKMNSI